MAYDTALNIISDAAAELGLGTVTDAYGSTDANIIQLRGFLKSGGKDVLRERDWTHLVKEYAFVTRENWEAGATYLSSAAAWAAATLSFSVDQYCTNSSNLYRMTTAGTTSAYGPGPNTTASSVTDGSAVWEFVNTGSANIVTNGLYYYTCTAPVTPGGVAGTVGPYGTTVGATETDGGVTWSCTGYAADYALPSDFSKLIDQTGWNRTNSLPLGGPLEPQEWQYLKGREEGVTVNVLFRPVAGVMRLYPDTDTPGGYAITFEYQSSYWVSATGGTAATTDAPTANTDIIYFDAPLMIKRLKLDWLKAKGFDTTHAQREYDDGLEGAENADGSAPVLNLRGRRRAVPLLGVGNIPDTGYGS